MLHSCSCGTVIEIPTNFYWYLSLAEIEYKCTEKHGLKSNADINPWTCSILQEGEQESKVYNKGLDEGSEEDEEDEEDTWIDTDMSLSGLEYDD